MSISAEGLKSLIDDELATLSDVRVVAFIRAMLVEPHVQLCNWDYGAPGEQYPCWMVLMENNSEGEIGYCEHGFGPRCPWGLLGFGSQSMGMDSGWFASFLDAFFDSAASAELPIWRVFRIEPDGTQTPLTGEGAWESTWSFISDLRSNEPAKRYDCGHSIKYGKQNA